MRGLRDPEGWDEGVMVRQQLQTTDSHRKNIQELAILIALENVQRGFDFYFLVLISWIPPCIKNMVIYRTLLIYDKIECFMLMVPFLKRLFKCWCGGKRFVNFKWSWYRIKDYMINFSPEKHALLGLNLHSLSRIILLQFQASYIFIMYMFGSIFFFCVLVNFKHYQKNRKIT